jgi:hypothetical protein
MPFETCTNAAAPIITTRCRPTTSGVSAPSTSSTPPTNSTNATNDAETIAAGMPSPSNWSLVCATP